MKKNEFFALINCFTDRQNIDINIRFLFQLIYEKCPINYLILT